MPDLRSHASAVSDGDVFVEAGGKKIRFAIISAPFVGHTVNSADRIANEQPSFQAALSAGEFVSNERKMLDKNRPRRERPFPNSTKTDLFVRSVRRAAVRNHKPASL